IKLIDELNLSSGLSWISPKNGIYINSTIYSLSSPSDLLLFKELSFAERLSLGNLLLKARLMTNWIKLESVTAREWVVKHSGENVYKKVWEPLLHSKFDQDADQISAAWLWNRIKLRSSTRGKTLMSEVLGYLNGSFQVLYEKLASKIKERGGTIECSKCVSRIIPKGDRSLEVTCDNQKEDFERVIITSAPSLMRDLGLPLPVWYIEKIKKIKYKANICMILELSEQLSPFYWIAVAEKDYPFVAVIEHTNLVPINGYKSHVVYLSRYIDENNELFLSPDEEVKELFIKYLKRIFPKWDESTIIKTHLNRARYVQPVIFTGYSEIVPQFKTPIDNLYLA
ncbi:MAG: FAD-dependent oxidoreductase, partial [Deltaproteobacteria bacterium]|nr:FAD-dependent oxidoreductase [Deltaproteobacteria bacterium]